MSIYSKSPKNLLRREERFSLRKFKNGLASVTVGATLFFAGASSVSELENSPTVYAAEIDEETAAEGSSQALATPVEESFDFKPETLINSSPWIAEEKLTDSSVVQPGDMGVAATEATAEVVFEDKTVNITATVESTNGNPDGTVQILELNSNQSSYGGTNDHFIGDAEPKDIPTLDVYVPARRLQPGEDVYEKLNFEGEYEMGILTVNFSEEVVNPVLDISGLGGSVQIGYADAGRGAFNATKLEVMNDEVGLRVLDGSLNLKAEQNVVEVASQDTYNRANNPEHLSPAGTGSVLIEGAFTELKFKLYHQVLRYSSASGSEQRFSAQNSTAFDGLNGLDSSYFDHYSLGTYVFYDRYGRRYTETVNLTGRDNADLFRLSFRLQSGKVLVDYVDTEGIQLKPQYEDTPITNVGSPYDTQENTDEYPAEIVANGKTYHLVPAGSYAIGEVVEDGHLTATTTDYGTDDVSGKVAPGTNKITYVYQPGGDVIVHYVINGTDDPLSGEATGIVQASVGTTERDTEVFTKPGTAYDTTDLKPTEIKTAEGKVYRLVEDATAGDPEQGEIEADKTKEITYKYEEVTGSVTVEYLTEDGEVLIPKADVKRDASLNETYETSYPGEIITEDGRTFRYTRVDDAFDATTGNVEEGEKHVVYRYEEVKGDVVVNYVDTNGNVIKLPVVDTPESSTGTGYDTTDNKPTEITTEDGKTYRLVPALTQGNENGEVVEGTTEITYVYEEVKGDVVVNYVDKDGNVIKAPVVDTPESSTGTSYDTTDNKPETITTEDGKTYRLVPVLTQGNENGEVVEGTTEITYVYEEVKGDVVVNYVDKDGNVIKAPVVDTPESSTGTGYDTTDNKPETITTEDGKVYRLVPSLTQGNENGDVVEGTTEITYVYEEVTGSVTVEYLTEDGEVLIPKADVKRDASLNETYETTYPEEITTEDGRTFRYTRVDDAFDAPSGDVEEGEKHVVYRYEEVKGDVVVNYVDTNGNVIKLPVVDTPESSTGTGYDTIDNKPTEITTEDGKVYRLVPSLTQGNENGEVVEGTTEITYVYEEVKGSVIVEYLTEDGEVLIPKADVKRDASLNETYETTYPEEIVTEDGRTFRYTRVDDAFDAPSGDVEEGEKHVVYRYEEVKGDVVVNYVDTNGNVIKLPVVDTPESSTGTGYDTTDNKPTEITTEDGKVYRLVPSLTQGNENGDVVEGTTEITYVYEEVTGSVTVEYLTEDGEVLIPKADVKRDASLNETYETTYPEEIITEDGRTFRYTRVDDAFDAPSGDVEEGEKHVVYRYEEVKGDVVVNYVDTNGNVIKLPVVDTPEFSTGTGYDTTDNKPTEITTEDGKVYRLVPALTQGNENGDVVEGTTEITYVYEEVVEEPVVEQGNLEVHYHIVDADGNVIVSDAIEALVKESSDAGTAYDTTSDRLSEITVNGKNYVLVADLTDGDGEMGTIVANDNKIINYYYVEIEEEIITPSEPEVSTPEFSDEISSEVILPSSDPLVIVYKNPKEGASSPSVDILSPEIVKDESTKEIPSPSEVEKISSETVHKIPNEQILSEIELSLPDVTATPLTKTSESEINIPTSEVIASPSVETTPSEIEESISEVIEEIPSKANETEIAPPISEVVDSPSVEISPIEMEQPTSEVVEEVPTTVSEAEGETPVSEEGSSSSVDAIPSLSEIEVSNEEVVSNLTVSKQLFHFSSTSSEFVSDLVLDPLSHSKEINQQVVYVAEEKQALPNTGEESNTASLTGLSILLSAFGAIGLRRRKED